MRLNNHYRSLDHFFLFDIIEAKTTLVKPIIHFLDTFFFFSAAEFDYY